MQPTGRGTITVHKEGDEGTLQIDRDTGQITGPAIDERPDWADGLAVAQVQERVGFYESRLGAKHSAIAGIKNAEGIAYQDLGWVGSSPEHGGDVELDADSDYRMDAVAKLLGVDREDFQTEALFGKTVAEVEIAADYIRSRDDATVMNDELARSFKGIPLETEVKQRATR